MAPAKESRFRCSWDQCFKVYAFNFVGQTASALYLTATFRHSIESQTSAAIIAYISMTDRIFAL